MKLILSFNTLSGRQTIETDCSDETLVKAWNFLSQETAASSVDFVYDGHMVNARLGERLSTKDGFCRDIMCEEFLNFK